MKLDNCPFEFPKASATQWHEYVFVVAIDGKALLYNTKHRMWSTLPQSHRRSYSNCNKVVNFKGQLILLMNGTLSEFHSGRWKDCSLYSQDTNILAVGNDKLYVTKDNQLQSLSEDGQWKVEGAEVSPGANWTTANYFITEKGFFYVKSRSSSPTDYEIVWQSKNEWHLLSPLPYTDSTLHVVKDTLFAFGGRDEDSQPTSDVLRYNPDTDSWESAGYMRSARHSVTVVTVQQESDTELLVIGGSISSNFSKSVEKCIIKEHTNQ